MISLRVERAIRLLPAVDVLEPLRILLMSSARADDRQEWSSSGPYLTLGKREVDVEGLRERVAGLIPRVTAHLTTLYTAYVDALAAWEQGDAIATVAALATGGAAEERARRPAQAHAWYDVAFHVATGLKDRGPEIEALDCLARTSRALGRFAEAARDDQRALVLAEVELDTEAAIRASAGLGHSAREGNQLDGAHAWYVRALRGSNDGAHPLWVGRLEHALGIVAWLRGDTSLAREHVLRARSVLEPLEESAELARTLCDLARFDSTEGQVNEGLAALREALAWARRAPDGDGVIIDVLLELARFYVLRGQFVDAEHELRRAEQLSIDGEFAARLVEVYIALGRICRIKHDETGFVFFEQALVLCRIPSLPATAEARALEEYGHFRRRFGYRDEARAHFERARQMFQSAGDDASVDRLRAETDDLETSVGASLTEEPQVVRPQ